MPQIIVLPHEELCPEGALFEAEQGAIIFDLLQKHGIEIEKTCEKSCACTSCHVVVREGFESLNPLQKKEEKLLRKAWGLEPESRLSCQAAVSQQDLVIEIPKYTINMA